MMYDVCASGKRGDAGGEWSCSDLLARKVCAGGEGGAGGEWAQTNDVKIGG